MMPCTIKNSSFRVLLHHLGECRAELRGALPVGVLVVLDLLLDPLEPLVQLRALVQLGAVDGLAPMIYSHVHCKAKILFRFLIAKSNLRAMAL